jgi:hypothetical protein
MYPVFADFGGGGIPLVCPTGKCLYLYDNNAYYRKLWRLENDPVFASWKK